VKDVPSEGLEVLTWHSEEQISKLAIAMADLNDALVSTGVAQIRYPDNITYANFIDYLLVPTLVYHLEYPRTKTSARAKKLRSGSPLNMFLLS
jgi:sterol O-acyltransferase